MEIVRIFLSIFFFLTEMDLLRSLIDLLLAPTVPEAEKEARIPQINEIFGENRYLGIVTLNSSGVELRVSPNSKVSHKLIIDLSTLYLTAESSNNGTLFRAMGKVNVILAIQNFKSNFVPFKYDFECKEVGNRSDPTPEKRDEILAQLLLDIFKDQENQQEVVGIDVINSIFHRYNYDGRVALTEEGDFDVAIGTQVVSPRLLLDMGEYYLDVKAGNSPLGRNLIVDGTNYFYTAELNEIYRRGGFSTYYTPITPNSIASIPFSSP